MKDFTVAAKDYRTGKRVWIEGKRLTDEGWHWHDEYTQTFEMGEVPRIVLEKGQHVGGSLKTVSGRSRAGKEMPILDITGTKVGEVIGDAMRARVVIDGDLIVITAENEE